MKTFQLRVLETVLAAMVVVLAWNDVAHARDEKTNRFAFGVYVANQPAQIAQFESWMGCRVTHILAFTGQASWADYTGSVPWAVNLWRNTDRPVTWSVPLIPVSGSMTRAAAGDYDHVYRRAALHLANTRPNDADIFIRTGWEFNGDWMPWSAIDNNEAYISAFRHFVLVYRSVSPRFRFEWNVNIGNHGMNPTDAYPGDDFVDVIGMDFYYNTAWYSPDPERAWQRMLAEPYGLRWHRDFAASRDKPMAYSEWGVMTDNAGPFIDNAAAWFRVNNVLYANYWNSNSSFRGKLSDGALPDAGAAFRRNFSRAEVCG